MHPPPPLSLRYEQIASKVPISGDGDRLLLLFDWTVGWNVFFFLLQTDQYGRWSGGGCLELAMQDPALLVRTLEVSQRRDFFMYPRSTHGTDSNTSADGQVKGKGHAVEGVKLIAPHQSLVV